MSSTTALEGAVSGSSSISAMPASLAVIATLTPRKVVIGGALVALGLLFGQLPALVCLMPAQAAFLVLLAAAARAGIIASGLVHRDRRLR